jgi:hypothetical protein
VMRVRPCEYFRRFQATIGEIRCRLSARIHGGRWPPGMSYRRQGNWLRALHRRVAAHLDNTWRGSLLDAFDLLMSKGQIPVSRSL